jgi:hypothetical protein
MATAQISGAVHDQTGAFIPGAQIHATQTATGVTTTVTANEQGIFAFPSLAVGTYTVNVSAVGFTSYRQTNLVLTVGQQLTLDVALKIGTAEQIVTVTADTVSVDSSTPTVQSTVEQTVIEGLPLNGRNPAALSFTVAGTTDATLNSTGSVAAASSAIKENDVANPQESAPSIHGARPGGTYFSLDGANNTDPFSIIGGPFPNPDATGEFSVVTGTYGAEFVSAPGGAINIVSRAGTNDIHGSVFEFIRNGYFNARNALSTQADVLKRNQFGFAVGAPIIKNRLFIFGTYQATPTHNSATSVAFVPTPQERIGNFGIFQIPSPMMSPSVQKLLQYIPQGDPTTGYLSYQTPQISSDQQGLAKIDLDLGRHRIFARSFYDRYTLTPNSPTTSAKLLAGGPGYVLPWFSNAIGDTWTRNNWTFNTRASLLRALATQSTTKQLMSFQNLGITGMSGIAPDPGLALTYVLGDFTANNGATTQFPRTEFEVSENDYLVKGKNQVSFGADYRHINLNETNTTGENPIAVYVGVNTLVDEMYGILPISAGVTPSLNAMADFIMGAPYTFLQGDGIFANFSGNLFGLYAEDNFHATNKLTVTAGLRWDPFFPYKSGNGRITCFKGGSQSTVFPNALPGLLFPSDTGCPAAGAPSSVAQIEPRVGLAYQLDSKGRTALRAGYGRYDLQFPLNTYTGFSAQPWVRSYEFAQPFMSIDNLWASVGLSNPFSSGFQGPSFSPSKNAAFTTGLAAATFDQSLHPGYVQQWSFSVQQLLTSRDSVDIAYVGSAGVHLTLAESLNTPVYENDPVTGAPPSTTNEQDRRPYPDFTNISNVNSDGTSSYNGLDVTFRHRGKGFTLSPALTWGKALDDNSSPASSANALTIPYVNDHNFRRGRSDFDQNVTFRTTGTWTGPGLDSLNRAAKLVAGGWQLSGLLILDAGQPFSVTDGSDYSNTGLGFDHADRVPGVPVYKDGRLNLAAFTDNAQGTFGNSGRNAYRGPSYKDVDIGAMKDFPVYDRIKVTFRAEAFNVLNHPNFEPPNAAYGAASTTAGANFGTYTIARDPRIMQFSLKTTF